MFSDIANFTTIAESLSEAGLRRGSCCRALGGVAVAFQVGSSFVSSFAVKRNRRPTCASAKLRPWAWVGKMPPRARTGNPDTGFTVVHLPIQRWKFQVSFESRGHGT